MMMREARLILSDGTVFCGRSFGYERLRADEHSSQMADAVGEVVFNTAMTGYPESLTDPSYAGQILVTTYPLIGNYGVPDTGIGSDGLPLFMESDRIHPKALIVADYSEAYSHWNAKESLASWLKREKVPAITGIDTRRLTQVLREHGVMMGKVVVDGFSVGCGSAAAHGEKAQKKKESQEIPDYGAVNWVERVSCKDIIRYNEGAGKRVLLVDCGVKANIIRCLLKRGVEVIRVPWDYDFNQIDFDGLFLANGPGDPEQCGKTVEHIRKFLNNETVRPCMGICLGNQLLARAAGAKTYKLKYGHRSHNQPVREMGTNRCFITSQNHGYAVDDSTLPSDWEPLFVNMNDGSNEGIRHKSRPWFSAQFHPEACSGPTDTEWMFDEFVKLLG
jgi:carbamoyl-phosphate synthase small subunit